MSVCMDNGSLASLGFTLDRLFWLDAIVGLAVGITIVSFFGASIVQPTVAVQKWMA